jgi:hypothetical protein
MACHRHRRPDIDRADATNADAAIAMTDRSLIVLERVAGTTVSGRRS